jgi:serine/threonine protein kinase
VVDINAVEGTPYYLSPECVTDGAYQDNRSDIYSLGATLFHTIAGVPPFNYDSLEDVIYARLREGAPDIRDVCDWVPSVVADVLRTMMAPDPEDRYVTARECLHDIERVRDGRRPLLVDRSRPKVNY